MIPPGGAEAARFRPGRAFEDLDLRLLEHLPPGARSREVFLSRDVLEAVVDDWCWRIARDLGFAPGSPDEVAARAGVAPDRRGVWEWLLAKLVASGLLERAPDGGFGELGPRRWSEAALGRAMEEVAPVVGSSFELMATVGRSYPAFLRGEIDGPQVLLSAEARRLWYRYFHNENVVYGIINVVAAYEADRRTGDRGLRVLEVGGGCGSGAELLLERTAPRVRDYWFTEPVPWFVMQARQMLEQRFPEVPLRFGRLDLNKPLDGQDVPEGSFDLVYAVNVLHVVRDIVFSLRQLRDRLRPGGVLVLGEAVRPSAAAPVAAEFVFLMMPEFREVRPEREFGPTPGFLQHRDWLAALARAGLEAPRCTPDLDRVLEAHPNYTLAALSAERGRQG